MKNTAEFAQGKNFTSEKFIAKRIVVKIGSSTITGGGEILDRKFINNISKQVGILFSKGVEILIVTSGAVASGKRGLRNIDIILNKQVAALYGQPELISEWRKALNKNGVDKVGQLLATETDLKSVKPLLDKALLYGVVVVNANDPVSDYEMKKFLVSADNDKLAGFLAKEIGADTLLLLTDVDGVLNKNGKIIDTFQTKEEIKVFSSSKTIFTGGILSKIQVAQEFPGRAIIANGRTKDILLKIAQGKKVGTQFNFA